MTFRPQIPLKLTVGLALAIALDTAVQLIWKTAVSDVPAEASLPFTIEGFFAQPMFIVVGALMLCQLLNWLKVLEHADLSFAKPITSLSYVSVCGLSVLLLDEHIHPLQMVGIAIVIAGVWFISRTSHSSGPVKVTSQ